MFVFCFLFLLFFPLDSFPNVFGLIDVSKIDFSKFGWYILLKLGLLASRVAADYFVYKENGIFVFFFYVVHTRNVIKIKINCR